VLAKFEIIYRQGIFGHRVHAPWKTCCFQERIKKRKKNPIHIEVSDQCRTSEKA